MADLHVYHDGHDTWVAESAEDATAQSLELYDDYDPEERAVYFGPMVQSPDDEPLTLFTDDESATEDGYEPVEQTTESGRKYQLWQMTMTCADWAKQGRGHLGGGDG